MSNTNITVRWLTPSEVERFRRILEEAIADDGFDTEVWTIVRADDMDDGAYLATFEDRARTRGEGKAFGRINSTLAGDVEFKFRIDGTAAAGVTVGAGQAAVPSQELQGDKA